MNRLDLLSKPWALEPAYFRRLVSIAQQRELAQEDDLEPRTQRPDQRAHYADKRSIQGVAVLPVHGVIDRRLPSWFRSGTDIQRLGQAIQAAAEDPEVHAIVLDIDSPGGVATGVPELAADIREVEKPVVAHVDGMAASAAYWIASATDRIVASPSSQLGSIGVYSSIADLHRWIESEGIDVHVLASSRGKAGGRLGIRIDDDWKRQVQESVDDIYAMFVADVERGRGLSREQIDALDAAVLIASRAVETGLADQVGSFLDTVRTLGQQTQREGASHRPGHEPSRTVVPVTVAPTNHETETMSNRAPDPVQPSSADTATPPAETPSAASRRETPPGNTGSATPPAADNPQPDPVAAERLRVQRILQVATPAQGALAQHLIASGASIDTALAQLSSDPRRFAHVAMAGFEGLETPAGAPPADRTPAPKPDPLQALYAQSKARKSDGSKPTFEEWRAFYDACQDGTVGVFGNVPRDEPVLHKIAVEPISAAPGYIAEEGGTS